MRDPNDIIHNGKTLAEWLEINQTEDTNLSGADLRGANLSYANLSYADLSGANLRGANLRYANLSGANGDYSLFYGGKHSAWATCTHIGIGCELHTHADWRERYSEIGKENSYTDDEIERYRVWIFALDWLIEKGTE